MAKDSQIIFYHIRGKNQVLGDIINTLLTRFSFCYKSFLLKNGHTAYIYVEATKRTFYYVEIILGEKNA